MNKRDYEARLAHAIGFIMAVALLWASAVRKFLETGDLSTLGGYDIPRLGDRVLKARQK